MSFYEEIGGKEKCWDLARAFFARVPKDPVLRSIYPGKGYRCAIEGIATFLVQFLGGPAEYAERRRWTLSLKESHARFRIGEKEREAWLRNMALALDDVHIDEPAGGALREFFVASSRYLVNSGPVREGGSRGHGELAERWDEQLEVERLVSLTRAGDAGCVGLVESREMQEYFRRDPAALLSWLAIAAGSGEPTLVEYACRTVAMDPDLTRGKVVRGRTLLHEATSAGAVELVALLLDLGSDPNAVEKAGHAPLYFATRPEIVEALVRAGARLDDAGCSLHQAARRGYTAVVEAMLDRGANIEWCDRAGETALRRAVNCGKVKTAELLLQRGADRFSADRKGITPLDAAQKSRSSAMRALFH